MTLQKLKFYKHKPIRLKGKKKIDLYKQVYERDGGCCVKCGRYVPPGTIPHHKVFKSHGGDDTLENLELLCMDCHRRIHHG